MDHSTTDTERYPRQSTGLRDWKAAEAYLLSVTVKSKDTTVHGETLTDCVKKFLDGHEENIGKRAYGQYDSPLIGPKRIATPKTNSLSMN